MRLVPTLLKRLSVIRHLHLELIMFAEQNSGDASCIETSLAVGWKPTARFIYVCRAECR